ncbi:hypothetical protein VQ056_05105 [Paenibacillus sp. JTLBN-2024]
MAEALAELELEKRKAMEAIQGETQDLRSKSCRSLFRTGFIDL